MDPPFDFAKSEKKTGQIFLMKLENPKSEWRNSREASRKGSTNSNS